MLKIRRFKKEQRNFMEWATLEVFVIYIGQEAVVVGVLMTIDKNDSVVTTYRDHGHMIARGLDPKRIMAELTGEKMDIPQVKVVPCICFQRKIIFMVVME